MIAFHCSKYYAPEYKTVSIQGSRTQKLWVIRSKRDLSSITVPECVWIEPGYSFLYRSDGSILQRETLSYKESLT